MPAHHPANDATDDVARFLAALDHPHRPVILAIRALILAADPRVREHIKWNAPTFHTDVDFATFHLRGNGGVQLVLYLGVTSRPDSEARTIIADPTGLLEWKAADRAIVTIRDADHLEEERGALMAVLGQWITFVTAPDTGTPDDGAGALRERS